jgi:hypothetical protein
MSEVQRLLDEGKCIITPFEGHWYMILPPSCWAAELLGDTIFRTGFKAETPEVHVREFYAKRLEVRPDDIARVS